MNLLQPISLGDLKIPNRITMGPMTRNRCVDTYLPNAEVISYYAQRATAGFIVSEGVFISPHGSDFEWAPILYDQSHVGPWREVTDAEHQAGGKIFFQAWHAGRTQHEDMPLLKQTGFPIQAPSNVPARGGKFRALPGKPGFTSNLTEIQEPKDVVMDYKKSVALAKEAGFDGIELLAQGGYLVHQFMTTHANRRIDKYSAEPVQNRCRFCLEVTDAILEIWPSNRVGIRICPADVLQDITVSYTESKETYDYLIPELMKRELGYINLSRRGCDVEPQDETFAGMAASRPRGMELPYQGYEPIHDWGHLIKYPGSLTKLMVNHEYSVEEAERLIREGKIDMISFGRSFITNPDLVERIESNVPLAKNDRGGGVHYGVRGKPVTWGYTDWPRATPVVEKLAHCSGLNPR